ncbi:unnamed protein product [Schistosoma margrebowiei]|uniref:Uncharacterized protein n=1 Tax=Schistosoma margrebowiei TaxID=48269 RepID=A0A183LA46_9TREM|nr:unnamed protein product [Schistosoma margrebowiei]
MVVGGSQQETLDPGFVLFGTHQQGVSVILVELLLPCHPDSQSETLPLSCPGRDQPAISSPLKCCQIIITSQQTNC